ncbi:hypothetical protein ACJ72_07625 [Emergomyces africanus]|uniref:CoA-binding domain-containing protein n=1 Tax=Emergomyces africanus TaxID=1955775 RepID=A0A1B7NN87_9EURO|nr:hypothetical protein ACJ72_07625 [Emergomyces africanus]
MAINSIPPSLASRRLQPRTVARIGQCLTSRFSTSSRTLSYADTLPNLKIGAHTRVLFQGFTGRQATTNVKESLAWGTKIVGGVKPGVEGEHLGLPVFPSVKVAQEKTKPDATAIYVPGPQTAQAIEEAIAAEIPLIVAVAEHVPVHDMLRVHSMLQTQSKSRLVGANCPGIISAIGKCRIGFQPLPCFSPGHIGIVAKSGTLGYETVASTTRAGLGQSLCISMGGDVIAGTDFVDALNIFEHDEDTHGIIIVGEIGGAAEMDAAAWISDYRMRVANPKPIMAVVGGIHAPPGRVMGHAGAWASPGDPDAQTKIKALQDAGAVMVHHPENFGQGMKMLLSNMGSRPVFQQAASAAAVAQQRGFHTSRRPALLQRQRTLSHRRNLYLKQSQSFDLLKESGIAVGEPNGFSDFFLGISIDRKSRSPCIIASPTTNPATQVSRARKFPFSYSSTQFTPKEAIIRAVANHLSFREPALEPLAKLAQNLLDIFMKKEAFVLETKVSVLGNGSFQVNGARFGFDDAAYKSSKRQEDIHRLRNKAEEVPEEVEAENDGIVYVKLDGEGSIGTLGMADPPSPPT